MENESLIRLLEIFGNKELVVPDQTMVDWVSHFAFVSSYQDYNETKVSIELWLDTEFNFNANQEEEIVEIILNEIYGEF
jgi:hypothetical protein